MSDDTIPSPAWLERAALVTIRLLVVLWVGALWAIGAIAVPTVFALVEDRVLAGNVAGQMFHLVGWLGVVCGLGLLLFAFGRGRRSAWRHPVVWLLLGMLLLVLIGLFGIAPHMADLKAQALPLAVMDSPQAGAFRFWHRISTALYAVVGMLGVVLAVQYDVCGPLTRRRSRL